MRVSITSEARDQLVKIAEDGGPETQRNVATIFVYLKELDGQNGMQLFSKWVERGAISKISSQEGIDVFQIKKGKVRGWFSITKKDQSHVVVFKFELTNQQSAYDVDKVA